MGFDPSKLPAAQPTTGFDPLKLPKAERNLEQGSAPEPQGLGDASGFDFLGNAKRTSRDIYNRYIQQQLIPTAASALATRLPALTIGGPAGLIAAPVVEGLYQGVAGYLGEKANQATGITPPDEGQAGLQGGIAGITAAVGKGYGMLRSFAGRKGAVVANDIAATESSRAVNKLKPVMASENLFKDAATEGASVPMSNTEGVINSIVSEVMRHDSGTTGRNLKSKLREHYGSVGENIYTMWRELQRGPMPADRWQFFHSRVGAKIAAINNRTESSIGDGQAKQLYGAMLTDLEQVAEAETRAQNTGIVSGGVEVLPNQGGPDIKTYKLPQVEGQNTFGPNGEIYQGGPQGIEPYRPPQSGVPGQATPVEPPPQPRPTPTPTQGLGATKLLKALQTYRDEKSIERLQGYLEKAMRVNKGQGGDIQFNASHAINDLKQDRFYPKAFGGEREGAAARKEIEDLLEHLNTAPNLPTHSSVNAGSKRMLERAVPAAAGYSAAGLPAATVGFIGLDVHDIAYNIAFAMKTQTGRALVKELSKTQGGLFNNRNFAVLSSYVTALQHDPVTQANTP